MGYVFISYSHNDQVFVDRLVKALSKNNIKTWVDRFQLLPGDNWNNSITNALNEADVILFILSPSSAQSSWVQEEIRAAILRISTGQGKLIIPLRIGATTNISPLFQAIQWIDFTKDFEQGLQKLLSALPPSVQEAKPTSEPTLKAKGYFFLSFVEEDSEFVRGTRHFLQEQGYGYWDFEEGERDYGLQFWREIEIRIEQAAGLICVVSPVWRLSKWTPREFLYAEDNNIPTFLLKASPGKDSILTIGMTHIDFTNDVKKGFSKLERALRLKKL